MESDWSLSPSDDGVLDGVGEGVAKVESASHVGRRECDNERTLGVGVADLPPLQPESQHLAFV